MEKTTGVARQRVLPPFARQRFSTWWAKRPRVRLAHRRSSVVLFQTCLVEYRAPEVGHDLVKVYEHNGIECAPVPGARCCGAPWLHAGDLPHFTAQAADNVKILAQAVRAGNDIVVPEPTCSYVLKKDYPDYVGGAEASLVAEHTYDACEYLMQVHQSGGTPLDTVFPGDVPETITYHTPCHLRAQNIGLKSRDLMRLTGARVTLVQQCSGIDVMWGLRVENVDLSLAVGRKLAEAIDRVGGEAVAGDCHLASSAIVEQTGRVPLHPIQVMARAYGLAPEQP
jgi:Fe-S oxidoreductase